MREIANGPLKQMTVLFDNWHCECVSEAAESLSNFDGLLRVFVLCASEKGDFTVVRVRIRKEIINKAQAAASARKGASIPVVVLVASVGLRRRGQTVKRATIFDEAIC